MIWAVVFAIAWALMCIPVAIWLGKVLERADQ